MINNNKISKELGLICGLGGVLSYYLFGMLAVILITTIAFSLLVVDKTKPIKEDILNVALALQLGHALGLSFGLYVDWTQVLPDLIVISIGIVLLFLFPGFISSLILSLYNLVALTNSLLLIINEPFWSNNYKALVLHIIIRITIILFLIIGCYKFKKKKILLDAISDNSVLNNENSG